MDILLEIIARMTSPETVRRRRIFVSHIIPPVTYDLHVLILFECIGKPALPELKCLTPEILRYTFPRLKLLNMHVQKGVIT